MLTEEIATFKSGLFVFSRKYSVREAQPLEIESRVLNDTIKDLPILPAISAQIDQELIKRSIFGTAAIEGNPLSEENVAKLIDDVSQEDAKSNHEIEIKNLKEAYKWVKEIGIADKTLEISEKLIKRLHKTITLQVQDQENNPGHYRNHKVQVGDRNHGGVYTPPKCLPDIKKLMKSYTNWLNSPELKRLYPPIRAALAHYHFGLIHPFGNGNGRTARLIEAIIIQSSGFKYAPIMLSNFYYLNLDDYFWAFSKTIRTKDLAVTHFVNFVLNMFIEALKEIKNRIIYFIRIFSMRDYFVHLKSNRHITQRQFDFLNILLEHNTTFNLKDLFESANFRPLYRGVSDRTARRDLNKLIAMKLLTLKDQKQYELNLEALG